MRLRWEETRAGMYCGFSPEGHQLAQVGQIGGPGEEPGWIVWLTLQQGELFDRYVSAHAAMTAAETAISLDPP